MAKRKRTKEASSKKISVELTGLILVLIGIIGLGFGFAALIGIPIVFCILLFTKVGLSFSFDYSNYDDINYIITDNQADDEIINYIKDNHSLEIIKVDPITKSL